jgi:hypothetical protein
MRKMLGVALAALLAPASTETVFAQAYPARPITMIVPFPAGGATDTLARFLAENMRPALGQSIVIENVAGAAGSLGVGRAVRAGGDGYTLSIGTSTTHMLTGGPSAGGRSSRRPASRRSDQASILSSFCRQRTTLTSGGIGASGKLVFQSVTPTSPT